MEGSAFRVCPRCEDQRDEGGYPRAPAPIATRVQGVRPHSSWAGDCSPGPVSQLSPGPTALTMASSVSGRSPWSPVVTAA